MSMELDQLVKEVELLDVWLKQSSCLCNTPPSHIDFSKIEFSTDYEMRFNFCSDPGVLLCFIMCHTVGTIESKECFNFHNQFILIYKVSKSKILEKTLKEFTRTTALFNSYPFHREQIHTQSVKMGLPPVIIPLLKFIPSEKKKTVKKKTSK